MSFDRALAAHLYEQSEKQTSTTDRRRRTSRPPSRSSMPTTTGTVVMFCPQRFYGFIKPADGTEDVFVHGTAVERSGIGELRPGDVITFKFAKHKSWRIATDLQRAP